MDASKIIYLFSVAYILAHLYICEMMQIVLLTESQKYIGMFSFIRLQVLYLYKSQKSQICKEHPWYNFGKCH